MHDGVGGHEADGDGDGGGEEAQEHLGSQLQDLTDVAAEQHHEDHGVQDRVAQGVVGVLGSGGVPELEGAAQHADEVQQHHRGNILKELPLGQPLCADQEPGDQHQGRKIGKAIGDHWIPSRFDFLSQSPAKAELSDRQLCHQREPFYFLKYNPP